MGEGSVEKSTDTELQKLYKVWFESMENKSLKPVDLDAHFNISKKVGTIQKLCSIASVVSSPLRPQGL